LTDDTVDVAVVLDSTLSVYLCTQYTR